jgi:hypothetical protein
MSKLYAVTDGSYSDYHIEGLFDDKAKAEEFAEYYDYRVEEHDANPEAPEARNGFQYRAWFNGDKDQIRLCRISNERDFQRDEWVIETYCPDHDRASTDLFARDEEHARKIAADRLSALKAGSTFAYSHDHVQVPVMFDDGTPSAANHYIQMKQAWTWRDTKFEPIGPAERVE